MGSLDQRQNTVSRVMPDRTFGEAAVEDGRVIQNGQSQVNNHFHRHEEHFRSTVSLQSNSNVSPDIIFSQCIDKIQRDPIMQEVVIRLLEDPLVRGRVQELMKSQHLQFSRRNQNTSIQQRGNPFLSAALFVRNAAWDIMDKLVDGVVHVFTLVDGKIFGGQHSDPLDKPFKACVVMTMLILTLYIFRQKPGVAST